MRDWTRVLLFGSFITCSLLVSLESTGKHSCYCRGTLGSHCPRILPATDCMLLCCKHRLLWGVLFAEVLHPATARQVWHNAQQCLRQIVLEPWGYAWH